MEITHNCSQQTFFNVHNFVPDVLFRLLKNARLVSCVSRGSSLARKSGGLAGQVVSSKCAMAHSTNIALKRSFDSRDVFLRAELAIDVVRIQFWSLHCSTSCWCYGHCTVASFIYQQGRSIRRYQHVLNGMLLLIVLYFCLSYILLQVALSG